jgi:hypothetical protein
LMACAQVGHSSHHPLSPLADSHPTRPVLARLRDFCSPFYLRHL